MNYLATTSGAYAHLFYKIDRLVVYIGLLLILASCMKEESGDEIKDSRFIEISVYDLIGRNNDLAIIYDQPTQFTLPEEIDNLTLFAYQWNSSKEEYNIKNIPWLKTGDSVLVSDIRVGLVEYIESIQSLLIEFSGGIDINGRYMRPNDLFPVEQLFLGESTWRVFGRRLEVGLRVYRTLLAESSNSLILYPEEHFVFKNDPRFKNQGFAELYFKNVNMVQALERLNLIKLQILQIERDYYLKKAIAQ